MFNEDNQEDVTLENDVMDESEESEESTEEADQTDWEAEAKKWKAIAERNKKKSTPKQEAKVAGTDTFTVERTVLAAQGMPDELLNHLEKVAKFNGTSLLAAQKDPLFVAQKQEYESQERLKAAQVGASRGSGQSGGRISFDTPNLSRQQHMELAKKAAGR